MPVFQIATYNVWFLPPLVTFFANHVGIDVSPHKTTRALAIAAALPVELDVLVLCEAFCTTSTNILYGKVCERFPYRSRTLGDRRASRCCLTGKFVSGGVVVFSKHPIVEEEELSFGMVASRDDALADKGVIRVKISIANGKPVHLFATHTQAWNEPACEATRRRQIEIIKAFIDGSIVPKDEHVFVLGDLNVPRNREESYQHMLKTLQCENPNDTDHEVFSFNHLENALAAQGPSSEGTSNTLDYILISQAHAKPTSAQVSVLALKAKEPFAHKGKMLEDLSDHYPVVGVFELV